MTLFGVPKHRVLFIFFLSLHRPNNSSENNSILLFSPLQPSSPKKFFGRKNTGGEGRLPSPANLSFACTHSITKRGITQL